MVQNEEFDVGGNKEWLTRKGNLSSYSKIGSKFKEIATNTLDFFFLFLNNNLQNILQLAR